MKKNKKSCQLLSEHISNIADETIEIITADGIKRKITKSEALARRIFDYALGYEEQQMDGDSLTTIMHPPSLAHQQMVLDRLEGKVAPVVKPATAVPDNKLADRLNDESKKRINQLLVPKIPKI